MPFPVKQKTWTITANNAIADATLNLMMGNYHYQVSQFLLANGYTCKGSSSGLLGAMDGVNRWTAAGVGTITRGANTTTPVSWMVLTDGNGCDLLISYVGASDDVTRISYSPTGVYAAAGTPTHTPTATDELIMASATSVINSTAAATARTLFGWVDSEAKLCRILLSLNSTGNPCGVVWGLELIDSSLQQRTISPSVWGFAYAANAGEFDFAPGVTAGLMGVFSQAVRGGRSMVNGQALNLSTLTYYFGNFTGANASPWCNVDTELQGTTGYPIWGPFRLGSSTSGWTGLVGYVIDWWSCRRTNNGATCNLGDTLDNKNFMAVGLTGGIMWPWDGSTTPANGFRASTTQTGTTTGSQNADTAANGTFLTGNSEYVPLSVSSVTPTGPVTPSTIARRPGSDVLRLIPLSADPPAETGKVLFYSRLVDGQPALFSRYPDGTVTFVGAG